ncbi:MAG: type II toxin-antitoxin system RelE/ParE family toxin [Ardenticatenales bacterium]
MAAITVDIHFASDKLRRQCTIDREMVKAWGPERTKRLRRRLADLDAADALADMVMLPGRTHELRSDRAGQLAIDLDGPYRLIFEIADEPVPRRADGGLEWSGVRSIRILGIEDYHD